MAVPIEDYTPRYVGDLGPLFYTFVDHQGKPFSLAGVDAGDIVVRIRNTETDSTRDGQGTFVLDPDVTTGQATYTPDGDDVAEVGPHEWQASVPLPGGRKHFDIKLIDFLQPL